MRSILRSIAKNYGSEKDTPLGAYVLFVAIYNLLLFGLIRKASPKDAKLDLKELGLIALSTQKLSRVITRDAVTAPFRAPFARYQESLGYGEIRDEPVGKGLRLAIGEMITCNYCADMWVGLGLMAALKKFPNPTWAFMSLMSTCTVADFLHVFYESTRTQENVLTLEEERRQKMAS